MPEDIACRTSARSEWPVFSIQYTYNPEDIAPNVEFEPNEAVVYDATSQHSERWMSAKYGSYLSITEVR